MPLFTFKIPNSLRQPLIWIVAVWALLFLVQMSAPPDLLDNDQQKPAAYLSDILQNGAWVIQRDQSGDIASKPPIYYWLAAAVALARGKNTELALYLPGGLAVLGMALLIVALGRQRMTIQAGLLGALMLFLSPAAIKQMALARTDAVFGFMTFAAAIAAWRAWGRHHGWLVFWLLAAASTLTKGPLGLVLAAGGLLAIVWERRWPGKTPLPRANEEERKVVIGENAIGAVLFLLLCGGWLWLAWRELGPAVFDKLLGRELVGHAVRGDNGQLPFEGLLKPTLYFLSRFSPWGLLTLLGLWRTVRRPAANPAERRLERFIAAYFISGLALFSIFPHQRPDHLFPLMPAAALLAGREAALLVGAWLERRRVAFAAILAALIIIVALVQHAGRGNTLVVRRTVAVRALARQLEQRGGAAARALIYVDAPFALQYYLGQLHDKSDVAVAAEALRSPGAAFVAVRDVDSLRAAVGPEIPLHNLAQARVGEKTYLTILGNRAELAPTTLTTTVHAGTVLIEIRGAQLESLTRRRLSLTAHGAGSVTLRNTTNTLERIEIALTNTEPRRREVLLTPRAVEKVSFFTK